jgi:cytochrome b
VASFGSAKTQHAMLKAWHAALAGSFLVAYVTADENTYAMHQFAGYAVLAAIVARVAAGVLVPAGSPLRLSRPDPRASLAWLKTRTGRHPLFAWFAAALLIAIGLAALSGALSDGVAWMEHPHEAIAEASLWVIAGHVVFVAFMYGGRKWLGGLASRISGSHRSPLPKGKTR